MSEPTEIPLPVTPTYATAHHVTQNPPTQHVSDKTVLPTLHPPVDGVIEHPINIFTLSEAGRKHLLVGRRISIVADGKEVIRKGVPMRALRASCTKVNDLLTVKPSITQYRVYGKVDKRSIETLLDMFTTTNCLTATEAKLATDSFVKNVLLYQACLSLGVIYHHIKPLLNVIRAEITARMLTTEKMNTIVKRVSPSDPLFKHLVNDLCHRRFKKHIPDVPAFEKWLGNKKALQKMMVEIDQAHKKKREAIKLQKCSEHASGEEHVSVDKKEVEKEKKMD